MNNHIIDGHIDPDALEAAVRENERIQIKMRLEEYRDKHWRELRVNEIIGEIMQII